MVEDEEEKDKEIGKEVLQKEKEIKISACLKEKILFLCLKKKKHLFKKLKN